MTKLNEMEEKIGNEEVQYWIIDNPEVKPFGPFTYAVVDEKAGGIIAYTSGYSIAKLLMDTLSKLED